MAECDGLRSSSAGFGREVDEHYNYVTKATRSHLKKILHTFMFILGFLLSPLSWWNDLFVNIPLAYLMAIPFGLINKAIFIPMLIFFYWSTNIIGFILMHHSSKNLLKPQEENQNLRYELVKMLIISVMYTALVTLLLVWGVIRFPTEYFQ